MIQKWLISLVVSFFVGAVLASNLYASKVVIATSSNLGAYEKVINSFKSSTGYEVVRVTFSDDKKKNDGVIKRIWEESPDLIIALGSRALALVKDNFPSIPIVFALATNVEETLGGSKVIPGILLLPSPDQIIGSIKAVIPGAKTVAVIFDGLGGGLVSDYRWATRYGSINVIMVGLKEESQWDSQIGQLRGKADVAVLELGGRLVSRDFLKPILEKAIEAGLPIVTYSGSLVEMGAFLAVEPNLESVGTYLARMAWFVIEEGKIDDLGIRPPTHTRLIINRSIGELLKISIPESIQETAIVVGK